MAVEKEDNRTYNINLNLNVNGGELSGDNLKTPEEKQESDKGNFGKQPGVEKSKNVDQGKMAKAFAKQQGMKIAMAAVSNYGNLTGDYITQNNLQTATSIGMTAVNIGMAFAAGGVVGGAFAIVGEAISQGINIYNYYSEKERANKNARWLAQRAGYVAFK